MRFGSVIIGYGTPAIITLLAALSEKSRPSLIRPLQTPMRIAPPTSSFPKIEE